MNGAKMAHFLLIYDLAEDYSERRARFRAEHLQRAWDASDRGELVMGGALAEPADYALLLFSGADASVAERFAEGDPYVLNGLVRNWRVRPWMTVVGEDAAAPVRL